MDHFVIIETIYFDAEVIIAVVDLIIDLIIIISIFEIHFAIDIVTFIALNFILQLHMSNILRVFQTVSFEYLQFRRFLDQPVQKNLITYIFSFLIIIHHIHVLQTQHFLMQLLYLLRL